MNLILNFLLIPEYGYMAAAVTTFISYVFLLLYMMVLSRKLFIWQFPFDSLIKVSFASFIMGLVVCYLDNNLTLSPLLNLILSICTGVVIYLLMIFLLKELRNKEIQGL